MNIFEEEKKQISELRLEQEEIEKQIDKLISSIKKNCKHPVSHIVEIPYKPRGSHDWDGEVSDPPYRICKICGYKEEGWGCGYNKLKYPKAEITMINRHEDL